MRTLTCRSRSARPLPNLTGRQKGVRVIEGFAGSRFVHSICSPAFRGTGHDGVSLVLSLSVYNQIFSQRQQRNWLVYQIEQANVYVEYCSGICWLESA